MGRTALSQEEKKLRTAISKKKYYEKNKEKYKQYHKEYYLNNRKKKYAKIDIETYDILMELKKYLKEI